MGALVTYERFISKERKSNVIQDVNRIKGPTETCDRVVYRNGAEGVTTEQWSSCVSPTHLLLRVPENFPGITTLVLL